MKTRIQNLIIVVGTAGLLCGCGKSNSTDTGEESGTPPTAPATETAPAAETPKPAAEAPEAAAPKAEATPAPAAETAPAAAAETAAETAQATATDLTSQFKKAAEAETDKTLGTIGTELSDKVKLLAQSLGGNDTARSALDSTLQSLTAGKDSDALGSVFQVVQDAKLTPEQMDVAKQVGNLASAYVVQKDFSSLEGAQSDVANIVNSLRQGQVSAAVPSIQKVAQNASLTPTQKDIISTLADKYAPGLKKAADSVQQGIQSLPGLNK